jgi:hypothetical protein
MMRSGGAFGLRALATTWPGTGSPASRWLATGLLVLGLVGSALTPRAALADGAWLDDQSVTWNTPGMKMPTPVQNRPGPATDVDTRCTNQARPAETDEDRALERAGWTIYGGYEAGWGIRIVRGLAGYDGMCRPLEYQAFVFVDGTLAGTLSPTPMDARTDGSLIDSDLYPGDQIYAQYARYTQDDALCCPSATSNVGFKIDRSGAAPVLVRESTTTQKSGGQ